MYNNCRDQLMHSLITCAQKLLTDHCLHSTYEYTVTSTTKMIRNIITLYDLNGQYKIYVKKERKNEGMNEWMNK